MKSHQQTLLLAILFSLASCDNDINKSSAHFGQSTAKATIAEVHYAYLNCYALDATSKMKCLNDLASKYIEKYRKDDNEYIQAFQFESEKQGFKHFLNDQKLPCESIIEGPEFISDKQRYLVKCTSGQQYLMQFDYEKEQWQI